MKPMIAFLLLAATFALTGCNTIQGVGKDIEKAGSAIERAGSN